MDKQFSLYNYTNYQHLSKTELFSCLLEKKKKKKVLKDNVKIFYPGNQKGDWYHFVLEQTVIRL